MRTADEIIDMVEAGRVYDAADEINAIYREGIEAAAKVAENNTSDRPTDTEAERMFKSGKLYAARAIRSLLPAPSRVCAGCGSTETIEEIRAKHPDAIACCPERRMVPAPAREGETNA